MKSTVSWAVPKYVDGSASATRPTIHLVLNNGTPENELLRQDLQLVHTLLSGTLILAHVLIQITTPTFSTPSLCRNKRINSESAVYESKPRP